MALSTRAQSLAPGTKAPRKEPTGTQLAPNRATGEATGGIAARRTKSRAQGDRSTVSTIKKGLGKEGREEQQK